MVRCKCYRDNFLNALRYGFQGGNTEDWEMSYEIQYRDDEWAGRQSMKLRNGGHSD